MSELSGVARLADVERARAEQPWADGGVLLAALMTVLCLIGLVMVLSASSADSLEHHGSPWYYFLRQGMWLLVGAVVFAITLKVDYHRWRRLGVVAVVLSLVMLAAVALVPGLGVSGGGSARWIGVGSWRLQPSEVAKLALVLFAADVLERRKHRARDWRYSMTPVLVAFVALAALVMAQPDMGTTVILACVVVAALFVAGTPLGPLFVVLVGGSLAAYVETRRSAYRWQRMTAFLHPFAHANSAGYQSAQSLVALGSGHLFGMGPGATRAATGYLPNQYTDFIYAIIGEETGLLGSLVVVGLFVAVAVIGIRIACRAPDLYGNLLVAGSTAWLVGQAAINMGAVVGLLPVTGVPLPFVSYGGSSLIIAMGAVGMCCNVARQSRAAAAAGQAAAAPRRPKLSLVPPAPASSPGPGRAEARSTRAGARSTWGEGSRRSPVPPGRSTPVPPGRRTPVPARTGAPVPPGRRSPVPARTGAPVPPRLPVGLPSRSRDGEPARSGSSGRGRHLVGLPGPSSR